MAKRDNKIELDGQSADNITALTLDYHRKILKSQSKAKSVHPEDRVRYTELVEAMDLLLKTYFQLPR